MVISVKSMSWIKDFAKGTHSLFSGQTLEGLQPIAFTEFWPMYYDLWVSKTVDAIERLNLGNKTYKEIKDILPNPSSIRIQVIKLILSYGGMIEIDKIKIKKFADFFARMSIESSPEDNFCEHSHRVHSKEEIENILNGIDLKEADLEKARFIGRLNTTLGSMVHGLYNDCSTDLGWDVFGPYEIVKEGKKLSFLIRYFPDMSPVEIGWDKSLLSKYKEITIYSFYENVEWEIKTVGCHTMPISGSPVTGMRYFSVVADGKNLTLNEISSLIEENSQKAEDVYKEVRKKDFEDLKMMILLQDSFQLKKLFDAAGMDWRPDSEMVGRIKDKPLVEPFLPKTELVANLEDYIEKFGIRKFAKDILGENI